MRQVRLSLPLRPAALRPPSLRSFALRPFSLRPALAGLAGWRLQAKGRRRPGRPLLLAAAAAFCALALLPVPAAWAAGPEASAAADIVPLPRARPFSATIPAILPEPPTAVEPPPEPLPPVPERRPAALLEGRADIASIPAGFAGGDALDLPAGERQWEFEDAAAMAATISPAAAPRALPPGSDAPPAGTLRDDTAQPWLPEPPAPRARPVLRADATAWTAEVEALLAQPAALPQAVPPAPPPEPDPASLALRLSQGFERRASGEDLRMLSDADAALYSRAFALQAEGRWAEADGVIALIQDPLLMGHLREQRLMHPTDYRASFRELQRWLQAYGDHPDAARIWRLAKSRQPEGASLAKPRGPDTAELDRALRQHRAKGGPARSEPARAAAQQARRDFAASVRSAYFDGQWKQALREAARLEQAHGAAMPDAAWYAGLSAWRLKRYEEAARHFTALAGYDTADEWEQAAGAYWAARAWLTLGRPTEAFELLQAAAEHSRTFYGLLAARRLGLDPVFGWRKLSDEPELVDALFRVPAVQRALGLAQIGRTERARAELQALMAARRRARDSVFLPMLTGLVGLTGDAHTAYRMAQRWENETGQHIDPAMYPEPPWQPSGGFTFDRALIYAFIRKESHFDPEAKSPQGARGLMQLMPATARFVAGGASDLARMLDDPADNLELGQRYIRHLERDVGLGSDLIRIAIAYNAGPGNLQKWDRQARHGGDPLLFIESLPSAETRDFVERILTNLWVYRARLGQPSPSLDDLARGSWPRYVPQDPETQDPEAARESAGDHEAG